MLVETMAKLRLAQLSPAALIFASFAAVILLGAMALCLPWSTVGGELPFLDALFTATSAVCVTGLAVVDTGSYFTLPGQIVILVLIQLGGLGIMTISVALYLFLGRRVPLRQRLAMQDVFAHTPRQDINQVVLTVLAFTFLCEGIGVLLLFWYFSGQFAPGEALYQALFHAVSAFCNAGFGLFPDSFVGHRASPLLNLTICGLIVTGGIGFPVAYEFYLRLRRARRQPHLSLHAKVVLITTAILIAAGVLVFAVAEWRGGLGLDPGTGEFWLAALFQSITARTAGFNTVDLAALTSSFLVFVIFLMFFGASPGSCGGGIKTTTLAVLGLYSLSRLRGRAQVNLFRRTVPREVVQKSISLFVLAAALVCLGAYGVLLCQELGGGKLAESRPVLAYLFEVVSAFGTVGLSMGVTADLTAGSKLILIGLMLVGRLGVPTFSLLVGGNGERPEIVYAEEKVMLG